MKSVYCIIVSYNGIRWIEKCLASLPKNSSSIRVLVVDNGSTDGTPLYIRKHFPYVECIETGKNLGFGQANNLGMRIALRQKMDYVFLLNQDAWVEPDTLTDLTRAAEENPEYGILSPLHLKRDKKHFEDHFLNYLKKSDTGNLLTDCLMNKTGVQHLINSPFVNAACWLIRSACFMKTGGFDPVFFHYGEDDHYAQRIKYHGFKLGIVLTARVVHDREMESEGKTADNLNSGVNREWIYFLTQICDINKRGYLWVMLKRGLRHFLLIFPSLFQSDRFQRSLHITMCRNIFSSFLKVKKSRKICRNAGPSYLT